MVRAHTSGVENVLTGSHSARLIIDVFHGSDRVMQGVEATDWTLEGDLTRDVKFSGSATFAYQSVSGESAVPKGTDGVFSPFKARLLLTMEIAAGGFSELITLGWARVVTVPSGVDYFADSHNFGRFVVASIVQVEFLGLEENVRRRGFRYPEQPPSLTSTYAELRRVTGMTVVQTVPDKALPAGITYDTSEGGRLKGVQMLWDNLGCVGVINSTGAWVGVPKVPGDPVGTLAIGPEGTIIDMGYEADTDTVYNCVVGTFEDADRNPIYAVAEVLDGPLATSGLYEENTTYYSSSTPTTQATANATVRALLSQSIGGQTYQVPITCIATPLIELGDVLEVTETIGFDPELDSVRPEAEVILQGRAIHYRMSKGALMDVTLEVQRSLA